MADQLDYETILVETADHVTTVTLNRPEKLNAFNQRMCDEFSQLWHDVRHTDDIHCVVIRATGDRAFCTGVDVADGITFDPNIWSQQDPGVQLSPKQNKVWKPVIVAAHGMTAGGAFYWINEADIVICADDAQFFDPHVSYGRASVLEPIGLARRIPLGEALRWALLGLDERMSAARALQIGLVSEVVSREELWPRAQEIAAIIAAKPPVAIQGTVKALWGSLDMTRSGALAAGDPYWQLSNPLGRAGIDFATFERPKWKLR
jgi:enoyl-CoA hydratase/carnithine racemase